MMSEVEDAFEDWAHYNWRDDQDMDYAELAFVAGFKAAREEQ